MGEREEDPDRLNVEAKQALEHDRADDEEAALDELIAELSTPVEEEALSLEEFVREDEFVCRFCHLVLHRSRLADRHRMICTGCAGAVETAGVR